METRHFIKTLCKQKIKTFFLSTLIALNVKWYHAKGLSKIKKKIKNHSEPPKLLRHTLFKQF